MKEFTSGHTPSIPCSKSHNENSGGPWKWVAIEKSGVQVIDGDRGRAYPKQSEFFEEGHCLFLNAKNVTKAGFKFDERVYISQEKDLQLGKGKLHRGDLVLTTRGTLGNIGWYNRSVSFEHIRINSGMAILRPDTSIISAAFLYQLFSSPVIAKQVERFAFGSAQPQLTIGLINKLQVPIPPLPEQSKIADILSYWDEGIAKVEQTIAKKEKLKDALMRQLLFGVHRFNSYSTANGKKLLRTLQVPADWSLLKIGDITEEVSLKNGIGDSPVVLSCTKHKGLVPSLEYFGKQVFSSNLANYKKVPRNHFAYATNHIEEGSIGYQDKYDEALISPIYTVFKSKGDIDDRFLFSLFKSETYRHFFEVATSASVDRRGSLRWDEFANLPVALPSRAEQERIADVICCCTDELNKLRRYCDGLDKQKRSLMQSLLSGKVRVNVKQNCSSDGSMNLKDFRDTHKSQGGTKAATKISETSSC